MIARLPKSVGILNTMSGSAPAHLFTSLPQPGRAGELAVDELCPGKRHHCIDACHGKSCLGGGLSDIGVIRRPG
jgi:hypothetical protein